VSETIYAIAPIPSCLRNAQTGGVPERSEGGAIDGAAWPDADEDRAIRVGCESFG